MQSAKLLLLIVTASLAASCASSRVVAPADGCSTLAASILTRETPHAEISDTGDAAQDWRLYGVAETGQLNVSNRDKKDGYTIIRSCEERDAAAARRINAPWYAFWVR